MEGETAGAKGPRAARVFPFGELQAAAATAGKPPHLALSHFNTPVTWVEHRAALQEAVAAIEQCSIPWVALDGEWPPSTAAQGMALLQLATADAVYLIDVQQLGGAAVLEDLQALLRSSRLTIVGMALANDFRMLYSGARPGGAAGTEEGKAAEGGNGAEVPGAKPLVVEAARVFDLSDLECGGLAKLYGSLFPYRLCKAQQMSRWDTRPLSKAQLEYAALDVIAPLQLVYALACISAKFATALRTVPSSSVTHLLSLLEAGNSGSIKRSRKKKGSGKAASRLPKPLERVTMTVQPSAATTGSASASPPKLKTKRHAATPLHLCSLAAQWEEQFTEGHWLAANTALPHQPLQHHIDRLLGVPMPKGEAKEGEGEGGEEKGEHEAEPPLPRLKEEQVACVADHLTLQFIRYNSAVTKNRDRNAVLLSEALKLLEDRDVFSTDSWMAFDLHLFSRCSLSGNVPKDLPSLFRSMYLNTFMWTNRSLGNFCHRVLKYVAITYRDGLPPPGHQSLEAMVRGDAAAKLEEFYAAEAGQDGGDRTVLDLLTGKKPPSALKEPKEADTPESKADSSVSPPLKEPSGTAADRAKDELAKVWEHLNEWNATCVDVLIRAPNAAATTGSGGGVEGASPKKATARLPSEDVEVITAIESELNQLPQFHAAIEGEVVAIYGCNPQDLDGILESQDLRPSHASGGPPSPLSPPGIVAKLQLFARVVAGFGVLEAVERVVTLGNRLPSNIAAMLQRTGGETRSLNGAIVMGPTCTISTAVLACIALLFYQSFPAMGANIGSLLGMTYSGLRRVCRAGWDPTTRRISLLRIGQALVGHCVPSEQRNLFGLINEPGVRKLVKHWSFPEDAV